MSITVGFPEVTAAMRRARRFGYVRAGTADAQNRQIAALLAAAVPRDAIFTDPLRAAPRHGYAALRRHARAGDCVSVWRLDRLGRSLTEVLNTFEDLHQAGIRLHAIVDGFDSHTAKGRFAGTLLSGLAAQARALRVEAAQSAPRHHPALSRGRKAVMTPERAGRAVQLLGDGQLPAAVARAIGVSRSALYVAIRGDLAPRLAALPGGWRRHPPGRQSTMTADRVAAAVAAIASGAAPAAVAASIGVGRSTLYGALRRHRAALAADSEALR